MEYLDNRHLSTKHENHTHLEKKTEGVTNIVGVEFLEALSTITTLKQKGLALSGLGQAVLQAPRLTGEDNGREGLEGVEDKVERVLIRVFGELEDLLGFPTVEAPSGGSWGSCGRWLGRLWVISGVNGWDGFLPVGEREVVVMMEGFGGLVGLEKGSGRKGGGDCKSHYWNEVEDWARRRLFK